MTGAMLLAILLVVQAGAQSRIASPQQEEKESQATVFTIDINHAGEQDFAKLPGIGPKLARRIVAFREKHGPFRRVEDLLAIRGIGHKKWRKIRPYLQVRDEAGKK